MAARGAVLGWPDGTDGTVAGAGVPNVGSGVDGCNSTRGCRGAESADDCVGAALFGLEVDDSSLDDSGAGLQPARNPQAIPVRMPLTMARRLRWANGFILIIISAGFTARTVLVEFVKRQKKRPLD